MIIPDDYAQANLLFTGSCTPLGAQVAFGLKVDAFAGGPDDVGLQVATELAASGLMLNFTAGCIISGILVKFGPNVTGPSAIVSVNLEGDKADSTVPANTAALIHKNTPAGGRAGRGRMYWPGLSEEDVDEGGTILAGVRSDITAASADWLSKLEVADIPMVLLHGEGSPISTPTFVNALSCDAKAATQRRRLRR